MKVYAIIALVVCAAAAASALDLPAPLKEVACDKAISQLTTMADKHPLLKDKINQAIAQLQQYCYQRFVFDTLANMLGLGAVSDIISSLHTTASGLYDQFMLVLEKIIFSGKFLWDSHIKGLLSQLVDELKGHAMNAAPIVASYIPKLLAVLAEHAGKREIPDALQRGIFDTVSDFFGLSNIWANVTNVAADAKQTLINLLMQAMLAGSAALSEVKKILANLAGELVSHAGNGAPFVQAAIQQIKDVLANTAAGAIGKREVADVRGFWESVSNLFGLSTVWSTITSVTGDIKNKFLLTLEKLMFAGTAAWQGCIPIFKQLVADLTAHAGNAAPLLAAAVDQLTALLPNGKRSFEEARTFMTRDYLTDLFEEFNASWVPPWWIGFPSFQAYCAYFTWLAIYNDVELIYYNQFLEYISDMSSAYWDAFFANYPELPDQSDVEDIVYTYGDLIIAMYPDNWKSTTTTKRPPPGKRSIDVEQRGLLEFAENFFGISGIISQVTSLGSSIKQQFLTLVEKVFLGGAQVWAQAVPIFKALVEELKNHAGNAKPLITQAIAELQGIVAGSIGKRNVEIEFQRGFIDYIEKFFGLSGIVQNIASLGSNLKNKFLTVITEVFLKGKDAWAAAQPIFAELIANLKGHAELAVPLFTTAVNQLTGMLGNLAGKREIAMQRGVLDFIYNMFGIDKIIDTVSALGSSIKTQFLDICSQVFFAGSTAWSLATPIFAELVSNIKDHTTNALPLVNGAIAQLKDMLIQVAAQHVGKRGLVDSILAPIQGTVSQIGTVLAAAHGALKEKLLVTLVNVAALAGKAKEQAMEILKELAANLKDHASNAQPLIQAALGQLAALIPKGRGVSDTIEAALQTIANMFNGWFPTIDLGNLGNDIIQLVSHVTGPLQASLMSVLGQVLFAAQGIKEKFAQAIVEAYNQIKGDWSKAPTVVLGLVNKLKDILAGKQ